MFPQAPCPPRYFPLVRRIPLKDSVGQTVRRLLLYVTTQCAGSEPATVVPAFTTHRMEPPSITRGQFRTLYDMEIAGKDGASYGSNRKRQDDPFGRGRTLGSNVCSRNVAGQWLPRNCGVRRATGTQGSKGVHRRYSSAALRCRDAEYDGYRTGDAGSA